MIIEKNPVQFFTAVCYNWLHLLKDDSYKQIITDALAVRVRKGHVKVIAFVVMPNHIHLIWRVQNGYQLQDVQRDFLKFTSREIIHKIKAEGGELALESIYVGLKDRKYQVWKRNSMSIDLVHEKFFRQKFDYLHNNPCQAHWKLADHPEDYKFSSAGFYDTGKSDFDFLTHHDEL
ncbi:MAG: transposase [Cyclobacteriaceae bacterium]